MYSPREDANPPLLSFPMSPSPLHVIWQRDLSRPRYRGGNTPSNGRMRIEPREYDWICFLLRDFTLHHHPDDHFEVEAPNPLVVLDGHKYDPLRVQRYLRRLRSNGRSVGIIHIGDEFERAPLAVYDEASFVYRNYWRPEISRAAHCHYLPLGVNCKIGLFDPTPISERNHRWSFAGQIKGTREAMVDTVSRRSDGHLVLNETFNSGLPKEAYARLLSDTQVVLCPRGFSSVESYRLYEALEAGAIPLVEDDGGPGLFWEHAAPAALWTALRGGPHYWYDLARRTRKPSYWLHAFGSDFPCPRIYRWENVDAALDSIDAQALSRTIRTWWASYKSKIRADVTANIRRHLHVTPTDDSSPVLTS